MASVKENIKPDTDLRHLTSGSVLARNTLINLLGRIAPMAVAIFAIPILIRELGTHRFGVLTLVWVVIGYFSLFDLGLGRALTKLVAEKLASEREERIVPLIWTGMFLMLILGIAGASVVALLSPWLVHHALKVPAELQHETLKSFYLLALSLPIVISTSGLIGILEARQRFGPLNVVRIVLGVYMYFSPLLVLPFTKSLVPVVAVFAIGRVAGCFVYLLICFKVMPSLRHGFTIHRAALRPLLTFGGWITINNIVDPFMVYLDRFLIGSMLSITAVAYYVTPHEVVTKLLIFPAALTAVFFPAFSTSFEQDRRRTDLLFERALKSVFIALLPVTLFFVMLAPEGLNLWVGKEFAQQSALVLQLLSIGVLINSLAYVPAILIHAIGRPDLTAKLHLIELPLYFFMVWWMIGAYGIGGVALAWVARAAIDLFFLCVISRKFIHAPSPVMQRVLWFLAGSILLMALAMLPASFSTRLVLFSLMLFTFALSVWRMILSPDERKLVKNCLKAENILKQTPALNEIDKDIEVLR